MVRALPAIPANKSADHLWEDLPSLLLAYWHFAGIGLSGRETVWRSTGASFVACSKDILPSIDIRAINSDPGGCNHTPACGYMPLTIEEVYGKELKGKAVIVNGKTDPTRA
jgi:hypothetical protein